jgi:hypothetical protein
MTVETWPSLPLEAWSDTQATLHRWLQVIGKVKLALCPPVNHWWHVTLLLTSRGLTTGPIPWRGLPTFEVELDFLDHGLTLRTADGRQLDMALAPRSVKEFYRDFMASLRTLGIDLQISERPVEIPDDLTPFSQDERHAQYDGEWVTRWWRVLAEAEIALRLFRSPFKGKCSPVHFFWGSFDLAVTRFSGWPAPPRPGADAVTQEAYSEEVCSVGFWPGSAPYPRPAFYCYAAPEPAGLSQATVRPDSAFYAGHLGEFLLPYEQARLAKDPRAVVLEFCQSTYDEIVRRGWGSPREESSHSRRQSP